MTSIAVICPVLARPQNAQPLAASLDASGADARLVFVVSMADSTEQFDACAATGAMVLSVEWPPGPGDYARKIQAGYDATGEELVLLAADDLRFHAGWHDVVQRITAEHDAGVIGTNDLANPRVIAGQHATHPVVRRCYIDQLGGAVGEPGTVYHPGYEHNFVDVELVETAKARGCYAHAHDAVVEHRHPLFDRSVARDATYDRGRAGFARDRALYESRRHLWERERVGV